MLVDTEANEMSVTRDGCQHADRQPRGGGGPALAYHHSPTASTKEERTIKIDTVTVAGRELHGVLCWLVTPNTASMLLSLDVLNQIGGKFSIDPGPSPRWCSSRGGSR